MLDSLEFRQRPDGIEVGIFNRKQALKADNHNKFSSKSKRTALPARKFIPNETEGEKFRQTINKEVNQIIEENK